MMRSTVSRRVVWSHRERGHREDIQDWDLCCCFEEVACFATGRKALLRRLLAGPEDEGPQVIWDIWGNLAGVGMRSCICF